MKKIFISSILALALILGSAASAQAAFTTYLTVGSTGADVIALQTWLLANGFSIPAISSGTAVKGYFGQQTKAAVVKYQASVGLPSTGFVGPLTIAKLNGVSGGVVMTPITACPTGYVCTPAAGTVPPVMSTPGVVSTPGVAGTLAVSLWSTPSGVNVYKGQSYDVATYKVQANASDMAVSNLAIDFSDRIWLYANTITVKDETGAIVGSVNNLNASNFVELTVGSDYRVSVPVNRLVVKATQSKYLTINLGFNAVSDRANTTLAVISAQIRSVDGTGVTDTETVSGSFTSGVAGAGARSFIYNGTNIGQVFITTDVNQPSTQLSQISTSVQTQNVLLGIFDVKVANEAGTLQTLKIGLNTSKSNITSLFNNIQIKVGGQTFSASTICTDNTSAGCVGTNSTTASSTVIFTNMSVLLTADAYTPISVYATVAPDTSGALSGTSATTTLMASGVAGASTNNPSIIDATYNNLVVNAANITSNALTFSANGVVAPALSTTYAPKACSTDLATCTQTYAFHYSLTAGNNAIYVSKTSSVAISTTTNNNNLTVSPKDFSDDNTNGDGSTYFYIAPGQTKNFVATYQASGSGTGAGETVTVTSLNYGTDSTTMTTQLTNSTITNSLKAVLFN